MTKILLIDPSANESPALSVMLRALYREPAIFSGVASAMDYLTWQNIQPPEVIILNVPSPDKTLFAQLNNLTKLARKSRILLLIGMSHRALALEAINRGAHDFLFTPVTQDQIKIGIDRVLESHPTHENPDGSGQALEGIIGVSFSLTQMILRARNFAYARKHLLLRGERGVGKTHLAFALHALDGGAPAPQTHLYEDGMNIAELLQYQDGPGTLIIDLPERLANGALKQLELAELCHHATEEEVRLIFCQRTSRRGRRAAIPEVNNTLLVSLTHPPLRARPEDISAQFTVFSRRCATMLSRPMLHLSEEALSEMLDYDWPGNTRELHYLVFQLYMIQENTRVEGSQIQSLLYGTSAPANVAIAPSKPREKNSFPAIDLLSDKGELRHWEAIEADYLRMAFHHYAGHKSEIARKSGLGRSTLYRKAKNLDLA